jgi:hypothetical protein
LLEGHSQPLDSNELALQVVQGTSNTKGGVGLLDFFPTTLPLFFILFEKPHHHCGSSTHPSS